MDRIRHLLCVLALATVTIVSGCGDDTSTSPGAAPSEAPPVPPAASMSIDMSFFDSADGAPVRGGADASMEAGRLASAPPIHLRGPPIQARSTSSAAPGRRARFLSAPGGRSRSASTRCWRWR